MEPRWLVGYKASLLGIVHRRAQAQKELACVRSFGTYSPESLGPTNREKGRNVCIQEGLRVVWAQAATLRTHTGHR